MAASIDSYLRTLSYTYYLKKDSTEIDKINRSKENLLKNLDTELGILINRRFILGSEIQYFLEALTVNPILI
jgi:hypothetical protein